MPIQASVPYDYGDNDSLSRNAKSTRFAIQSSKLTFGSSKINLGLQLKLGSSKINLGLQPKLEFKH